MYQISASIDFCTHLYLVGSEFFINLMFLRFLDSKKNSQMPDMSLNVFRHRRAYKNIFCFLKNYVLCYSICKFQKSMKFHVFWCIFNFLESNFETRFQECQKKKHRVTVGVLINFCGLRNVFHQDRVL